MKKLFSIIAIAALALSLTACRNEPKQKEDSLPKGDDLLPVDVNTLEEARSEFPEEFPLPDGIRIVEPGAFADCTDIKIIYKGMVFTPN